MDDQIVSLRRELVAEKERGIAQYRSLRAEARAALRMICEVMEMYAPSGSVLPQQRVEPPLTAEAEALVAGILAMAHAAPQRWGGAEAAQGRQGEE